MEFGSFFQIKWYELIFIIKKVVDIILPFYQKNDPQGAC